jgi:hypothetical protein
MFSRYSFLAFSVAIFNSYLVVPPSFFSVDILPFPSLLKIEKFCFALIVYCSLEEHNIFQEQLQLILWESFMHSSELKGSSLSARLLP